MKTAALLYVRNDDYKENERVIVTLSSMLDTFDEVILLDWNTPKGKNPLLWEIEDKLPKTGRLKHMVIPPNAATQLTNYDPKAQACTQVLSSNIMLRRTDADWIVATTIDIIAPKKEILNTFLSKADKNTFYTLSRRDFEISELEKFGFDKWKEYRDILDNKSEPRYYPAKVSPNDDYSIINCCGDYQMAPKNIWDDIKGFEEDLIFSLYTDTNVQKKSVIHGFGLKALYNPALFHINHGKGGGGFLDGTNKRTRYSIY